MTIGVGTFSPNGHFAFPRSYVYRVVFSDILLPLTSPGPSFVFNPSIVPTDHYHITFRPNFWVWSSNRWTLDHIISDCFRTVDPSPTQIPVDFTLSYVPPDATHPPRLVFRPFGVVTPDVSYSMPAQPLNYWLPRPLS